MSAAARGRQCSALSFPQRQQSSVTETLPTLHTAVLSVYSIKSFRSAMLNLLQQDVNITHCLDRYHNTKQVPGILHWLNVGFPSISRMTGIALCTWRGRKQCRINTMANSKEGKYSCSFCMFCCNGSCGILFCWWFYAIVTLTGAADWVM